MDNKAIGDYLKQLRLRAGYKQSELGDILSVTDKAISRWESGLGTPELGNLMAIAKLYNIMVDDILNCNEAVFYTERPVAEEAVLQSEPQSEPQEEQKRSKGLSEPWNKFRTIIFFAYLVFGVYIASYQYGAGNLLMAFYVIYSVLVFVLAVISLLAFLMPQKVNVILMTVLDSLFVANTLGLMIAEAYLTATGKVGHIAGVISEFGCACFLLLFSMQLIYTLSRFVKEGRNLTIINLCALGCAVGALVGSIVGVAQVGFIDGSSGVYEYIGIALILFALSALTFALGQIFTKYINVFTAIIAVVGAVLPQLAYTFGTNNYLNDIIVGNEFFYPSVFLITAGVSVFCTILGWLLEDNKNGIIAVRITVSMSALLLLPFAYYMLDIFAAYAYIKWASFAVAVWMGLMIIIAVFAGYVRAFKPMQIIKPLVRGRKK